MSSCEQNLSRMYQGKQSAYMLFYRQKSLTRPLEAQGNLLYGVPERLQVLVAMENARLEEERQQYEIAVNTIKLNLHISDDYTHSNGALHANDAMVTVVSIDRRKTIRELKTVILEVIPEAMKANHVISVAKMLPAGMHLYESLSDNTDHHIIQAADILDGSNLFIWDGKQVGGEFVRTGKESEPIMLNITHPSWKVGGEKEEEEEEEGEKEGVMEIGRASNSTLGDLRFFLASFLNTKPQLLRLSQVKVSERNRASCVVPFTNSKDKLTLKQLKLTDGDRLAADTCTKKGVKTLAHTVADKQNNLLAVLVEDRCTPLSSDCANHSLYPISTSKDTPITAFKETALAKIKLATEGVCRLRLENGPLLYEDQSLDHAGVEQGQKLILELGKPPKSSELTLRCTVVGGSQEWEVVVDLGVTVATCCSMMVQAAGLEGTQWHLRKTNWCGEAAELLEDETAALCEVNIKSGDLLLIQEGKLPPKGYIRISISLYSPSYPIYCPPYLNDSSQGEGSLSWVMDSARAFDEQGFTHPDETQSQEEMDTKEVPLHLHSPLLHYPPLPGNLIDLGTVEISKDATVQDLKTQILTLPTMYSVSLPTMNYLRVREIMDGQLRRVLKQPHQTLRRLKFVTGSQLCAMILDFEEIVPSSAVFCSIQARIPGQRRYGTPAEIVYDTVHTKPSRLHSHIAHLLGVTPDQLAVAKHKLETFEWILLKDNYEEGGGGGRRGKRKKKSEVTANIKNAPISLRDGDILGVKDLQYDPENKDDFSTVDDERGRIILAAIQEEKRSKRKTKSNEDLFHRGSSQRPKRAEVGIKIFVPDYRRNS